MSTITTIASGDLITNSRADINNNFANLNADKIETSVIDTDTALAANSDAKIPSQKAVKAYVDAGGNVNASSTAKGIVELATQAEANAGTATGGTGAALVVTPDLLAGVLSNATVVTKIGAGSTTKDCSNTTSTTIAHGLGVTPRLVRITALGIHASGMYNAIAVYTNAQHSASNYTDSGTGTTEASSASFHLRTDGAVLTGTITTDSTNITIAYSGSTLTSTAYIVWEAFA